MQGWWPLHYIDIISTNRSCIALCGVNLWHCTSYQGHPTPSKVGTKVYSNRFKEVKMKKKVMVHYCYGFKVSNWQWMYSMNKFFFKCGKNTLRAPQTYLHKGKILTEKECLLWNNLQLHIKNYKFKKITIFNTSSVDYHFLK